MDGVSVSALIISLLTALGYFFKTIRKCKCGKDGVEIERMVQNEDGSIVGMEEGTGGAGTQTNEIKNNQQTEFTVNLINTLKSTPRAGKESSEQEREADKIIEVLTRKLEKENERNEALRLALDKERDQVKIEKQKRRHSEDRKMSYDFLDEIIPSGAKGEDVLGSLRLPRRHSKDSIEAHSRRHHNTERGYHSDTDYTKSSHPTNFVVSRRK